MVVYTPDGVGGREDRIRARSLSRELCTNARRLRGRRLGWGCYSFVFCCARCAGLVRTGEVDCSSSVRNVVHSEPWLRCDWIS